MRWGRLLVVLMVMSGLNAACSADAADVVTDSSTTDSSTTGSSAVGNNSDEGTTAANGDKAETQQAEPEQADENASSGDEEISAADAPEVGFSVLESLRQIPLSVGDEAGRTLQVSMADIDAAADQARIRRPLDPLDSQDLIDFISPLTGGPVDVLPHRIFVPLPGLVLRSRAIVEIEEFVGEVGFSPGDITRFVSLDGGSSFTVLEGVSTVSGLPEVAPGVGTFGEGEDLATNIETNTVARPLGRPLRVAERPGTVALSQTTGPLVEWAGNEAYATLADQPVLAQLATRLDEENVVSAFVLTVDSIFEGVGLGWEAEEQPRGVIVLAYRTAAEAEEQAPLVAAAFDGESFMGDRPMTELVTVDAIEVRGAEIVVTVRFPDGSQPAILFTLLVRGDVPFGPPD